MVTKQHKQEDADMWVVVLSLLLSFTVAQLPAPTSVDIRGESSTGFIVAFSSVHGADFYQVTVSAVFDETDVTTNNTKLTNFNVTKRRSNINYKVVVRAVNDTIGNPAETTARTAPSGSSILHFVSKPTFVTVFLEETPGATGWEVEYNNTDTGETSTLDVPGGTPSNTNYVAIITSLNPNTRYLLRARVAQIGSVVNYAEAQSPYGKVFSFTTEKVSTFGRVDLVTRRYTPTDNTNDTLRRDISEELLQAYQANSNKVSNVSVIELEDTAGNILCHHEIVLNVQSISPDVSALNLSDSTLYANAIVKFAASSRSAGYSFRNNVLSFQESSPPQPLCTPEVATDKRFWTLHDKSGFIIHNELLERDRPDPGSLMSFTFNASEARLDSTRLFSFAFHTIYGIEQTYLLKTCTSFDNDITIYDKLHGAFDADTSPDSNRYTIFYTTGGSALDTSTIQYRRSDDGVGVTLMIPSSLISRAIEFSFDFNGTNVVTLNRNQIDDSSTYMVEIKGLTREAASDIIVNVNTTAHDGSIISAIKGLITVTTDINECVDAIKSHNCHSNASCDNTLGSFNCTCNKGFSGNGTFCDDIDECFINMGTCSSNSICINQMGSYNCICDEGFQQNGEQCNDIDECNLNIANCTSNSTCINQMGSYNCICDEGFQQNGEQCNDIDECNLNIANCTSNSTCINQMGSYNCICDEGFQQNGEQCNDIDECNMNIANCTSNSTCINQMGSYNCICDEGFQQNGEQCNDIDECNLNIANCTSNSTCINQMGSYNCICDEGFQQNGEQCNDIDECNLNIANCTSNSTCINQMGSYNCICDEGFQQNGEQCNDIDKCNLNIANCTSNSTCINQMGSYNCICDEGFQQNGEQCNDIDECNLNIANCTSNSTCINQMGSYNCICDEGFQQNGEQCNDIDECNLNIANCTSNSTCINQMGSYNCICDQGFQQNGEQCKDIDECNLNIANCTSNLSCKNVTRPFTCVCENTEGNFLCRPEVLDVPITPPSLAWIAAPIVVVILLLALAIAVVYRRRLHKGRKGNYFLEGARRNFLKNMSKEVVREESSSPSKVRTGKYDVHQAEVEVGLRTDGNVAKDSTATGPDRARASNEYVNMAYLTERKIETENDTKFTQGCSRASLSEDHPYDTIKG